MTITGIGADRRVSFGPMQVDWETRIDWDRLRRERLHLTQEAMERAGVDLLVLGRIENCRYTTAIKRIYWPTLRLGGGPFVVVPRSGQPHIWITDVDFAETVVVSTATENLHRAFEMDLESGAAGFTDDLAQLFPDACNGGRVAVDLWSPAMVTAMRSRFPDVDWADGQAVMMDAQAVKTEDEIACLKLAYVISEAGMQAAIERLRPGVRECELVGACFEVFASFGSEVAQCSEVVNSGPGSFPYRRFHTDRIIQWGDMVNMDFGACFAGYFGDFCRAFVCGNQPRAEQREILEQAYELQQTFLGALRPGVTPRDLCAELGVHGFGHGIGITANNPPSLHDDETYEIRPGMTFAVLTPTHLGSPSAGGVHLEDQVVITDDGCEVYSTFPYFGIDGYLGA